MKSSLGILRVLDSFLYFCKIVISLGSFVFLGPVLKADDNVATPVYETYYLACYYYSPLKPHSVFYKNADWVWGVRDGVSVELKGYLDEGFLNIDDGSWDYSQLEKVCQNSIPPDTQIIKIEAGQSCTYAGLPITTVHAKDEAGHVENIIIFGDSLSDTSNLHSNIGFVPTQNYWNARFADGPIWVDFLKKSLPHLKIDNWSYGGLTTNFFCSSFLSYFDAVECFVRGCLVGSLYTKVENYLQSRQPKADEAKDNLYIMWVGINNFMKIVESANDVEFIGGEISGTGNSLYADALVAVAVHDLIFNIDKLLNHGARNFLIVSFPNLSMTPFADDVTRERVLSYMIKKANVQLHDSLRWLESKHKQKLNEHIHLEFLDINPVFENMVQNPQQYGMTVSSKSCYTGFGMQLGERCANPEDHMFYDAVHPSTRAHCWLGRFLFQQLQSRGWVQASASKVIGPQICAQYKLSDSEGHFAAFARVHSEL